MPHLPDVGGEERGQQTVPVAGVSVYINFNKQRTVGTGGAFHRQRVQLRHAVYGDVIGTAPQGEALLRPAGLLQYLHGGGVPGQFLRFTGGGEVVLVDELLKFQLQKQVVQLRLEGTAHIVLRLERQRGVGVDGGEPVAVAGGGFAVLEFT